jgi:arsenate reductase (glutaredoxin)
VDHEVREFFKQPITRDELTSILDRAGMKPSELVSTRSSPYRNENLGEQGLSEDQWLEKMLAEPRLIRRPIFVSDDCVEVGFSKARYEEIARDLAG